MCVNPHFVRDDLTGRKTVAWVVVDIFVPRLFREQRLFRAYFEKACALAAYLWQTVPAEVQQFHVRATHQQLILSGTAYCPAARFELVLIHFTIVIDLCAKDLALLVILFPKFGQLAYNIPDESTSDENKML
jgi:hypothetical protein